MSPEEVNKEDILETLHQVQRWLSGEQSKEKLAEKLGLNFCDLCDILPSDSVPTLYVKWLQYNEECK